jgi:4'-phosphopantetheinyl transferase
VFSRNAQDAALAEAQAARTLRFNLAHCQGLALYAIAWGREVGVDLEYIRENLADQRIAERFFSPAEVETLRSLPEGVQREAFFHCWTRKEAFVKARGEGLSFPLDQFDVSLAPGEPAALLRTLGDPEEAARWSLRELFPGPGFVAAVAAAGHSWRLSAWQWPMP